LTVIQSVFQKHTFTFWPFTVTFYPDFVVILSKTITSRGSFAVLSRHVHPTLPARSADLVGRPNQPFQSRQKAWSM
jgi:hypothetical protein